MRAISDDFRSALARNSTLDLKATLTLADGTVHEMAADDFMLGTASFESATSSESSFDVGAAVVGKCSLTLNNHDGRFDEYDFEGATVVPYVGKTFDVTRPDGFDSLSVAGSWALVEASDEMASSASTAATSDGGVAVTATLASAWSPAYDGEALHVRVRYAFATPVTDDAATIDPSSIGLRVGGTSVGRVTGGSCHVYAGTTSRPRTALAWADVSVASGEASGGVTAAHVTLPSGATDVTVSVVASTRTEWVRMGVYNTDQPDSYEGTIGLSCLDDMSRLSRPYSDVTTTYPCKPSTALEDIFRKCQMTVTWDQSVAALNDTNVSRRPDSSSMTCLQAASYLAQLMGVWVRCDAYGQAYVSWYDSASFEREGWLDGGTFADATQTFSEASVGTGSTYADGDTADGGSFTDYSSGDSVDGGTFQTNGTIGHLLTPYSSTVMTDDVVITGVQVTASNQVVTDDSGNETNGEDGETALAGSTGYVLNVKSNPFIEYGRAQEVATALYRRLGGMRFRPLTCTHPSDPSIEAGDPIIVADRKGNYYQAYATSVTLKVCDAMTVKCSAKSAARNSASTASAATEAIVRARNELRRERNARELAVANLTSRIADKAGLYVTSEVQQDGSRIYRLHDKPTVAESGIIWEMTATAMAVSTDGGKTWSAGLTADGNAILNRIYAIGIDADYITAGLISDRGDDGTTTTLFSRSSFTSDDAGDGTDLWKWDATWDSSSSTLRTDGDINDTFMLGYSDTPQTTRTVTVTLTMAHVSGSSTSISMTLWTYDTNDGSAASSQTTQSDVTVNQDGSRTLRKSVSCDPGVELSTVSVFFSFDGTNVWQFVSMEITSTVVASSHQNYWDLDAGEFVTTHGRIAGFDISDKSISTGYMRLSAGSQGLTLHNDDVLCGSIGSSFLTTDNSKKFLSFDLEDAAGMRWSVYEGGTDTYGNHIYNAKLEYLKSAAGSGTVGAMNLYCDMDMHGHGITNIKNGQTCSVWMPYIVIGTNPVSTMSLSSGKPFGLRFTNGILTSWNWSNGYSSYTDNGGW